MLSGLRPVQRGTASILLGEPAGIKALQQAFAEPTLRRETLDVLEVVGQGGAGEEELLAAALADPSAELRRRGVEVAAAIDRRLGRASHAATLRAALSDPDPLVRNAVLANASALPPQEAADVLRVALAHADPNVRAHAEGALVELAARAPAEAAGAAAEAAKHDDPYLRRAGLSMLERVSTQAPSQVSDVLGALVADAAVPEDTRVTALRLLRHGGASAEGLRPVIERAISVEGSPRLRAAALPIFSRTLEPDQAEELARTETKGPVLSRAAAAAIWGTLSQARPEATAKALKVALLDPAPEVRAEAARALGGLKRDGLALLARTLLDSHLEVLRGGLDASVELATGNAPVVIDTLTKGLRLVRPAWRSEIVGALGRVGDKQASLVLPPLIRAFKEGPGDAKRAVARTLCDLSRSEPQVTSPYLRLVARDTDGSVRAAAAACLDDLAAGDPKGAARLARELAVAEDPAVRAAAAQSLGRLAKAAPELVAAPLLALASDPQAPPPTSRPPGPHRCRRKRTGVRAARGRRAGARCLDSPG
ncbi:MAG: HEAT repeat domain-containing protein [Myxococcales bacterium]|nr:HEAT repeat domain-containing protein [Myxococcales bacterium]